jgi:uridylate kinase
METILIKLSGEVFNSDKTFLQNLTKQIKELKKQYQISIVLGGGNIWRGEEQRKRFDLRPPVSHTAGMLATIINGLVLQDIFQNNNIDTKLLSALDCKQVADKIQQSKIDCSLKQNKVIIFAGGTGNPFFTTDTNAVLRALQIGASQVWKGTKVGGVYSSDPKQNKDATHFKKLTYNEVIEKELGVMDLTAVTLANQHNLKIRVFNLFEPNALIIASNDKNFGSWIE